MHAENDRPQSVSIVIPTWNSAGTLRACLSSIAGQDYPKHAVHTIVVDRFSTDGTIEIARQFGAKAIPCPHRTLGARERGFQSSRGDLILFLDSDQMLKTADCLSRAVRMSEHFDILHMEERSLPPQTWLQRLIRLDAETRQAVSFDLNPFAGSLYARFFHRWVLESAFKAIPQEVLHRTSEHEDVLLHWKACSVSSKIGTVTNAVWHQEVDNLPALWRKMYRYGLEGVLTERAFKTAVRHKKLFRVRQIAKLLSRPPQAALIAALLALKAIPYWLGQSLGKSSLELDLSG